MGPTNRQPNPTPLPSPAPTLPSAPSREATTSPFTTLMPLPGAQSRQTVGLKHRPWCTSLA